MYDIYKVTPNSFGLSKKLVAGNYETWEQLVTAVRLLHKITAKEPTLFEIAVCEHRMKTSNHYRTAVTHTAPQEVEILTDLLRNL